jgi:hypothetical protein
MQHHVVLMYARDTECLGCDVVDSQMLGANHNNDHMP